MIIISTRNNLAGSGSQIEDQTNLSEVDEPSDILSVDSLD